MTKFLHIAFVTWPKLLHVGTVSPSRACSSTPNRLVMTSVIPRSSVRGTAALMTERAITPIAGMRLAWASQLKIIPTRV